MLRQRLRGEPQFLGAGRSVSPPQEAVRTTYLDARTGENIMANVRSEEGVTIRKPGHRHRAVMAWSDYFAVGGEHRAPYRRPSQAQTRHDLCAQEDGVTVVCHSLEGIRLELSRRRPPVA